MSNNLKSEKTNIERTIERTVDQNIQKIKERFSHTFDLRTRTLIFNHRRICIVYLDTIADKGIINERIIKPICELKEGDLLIDLPISNIELTNDFKKVEEGLSNGNTVLFVENMRESYIVETDSFQTRSLTEPMSEKIVYGSHDGCVESILTNINTIRKRIRSSDLKTEIFPIGETISTNIVVIYMENLASAELVRTVKKRIRSIKIGNGLTSGKLEEFIEDSSISIFPQILKTERPDRITANLMEGRVAVMVEGDATTLIMPVTFFSYYQSPDDFDVRTIISSFLRIIRLVGFFMSVTLPALYIAIVSFNYEIIPIDLVTAVKGSVDYVPFPPIVEAFIMQLILELLREAAIRLPSSISQTIGVVGGLVIGTAIVQANIVSNIMVVIIALTAISSFVNPIHEMSFSMRILGFPMMIAASTLGIVGITLSWTFVLMHLIKLRSFGVPYFAPVAPIRFSDWKDTLIRKPIWMMKTLPTSTDSSGQKLSSGKKEWKEDE
ncbi:spore germination protein [Neobacillus sp. NRS-1170]|uniref:spore germination protein n=1 Tax=Neobacillus sp. NRS-1170 TaxID=3233898 RepID=UPI003D2C0C57